MDNEKKYDQKNLNARTWGGAEELNVEGADAIVCIAITHGEDGDRHAVHIEGNFKGGDYMRIFKRLEEAFGKEHLMMYVTLKAMGGMLGKILGVENEHENETESDPAEGGDGEKPD